MFWFVVWLFYCVSWPSRGSIRSTPGKLVLLFSRSVVDWFGHFILSAGRDHNH